MSQLGRSRNRLPRGSQPDGSFAVDEPLACVAVALMVFHFYVRGHRDSWGSCRVCQEICDQVAPEHRVLRAVNTKSGAKKHVARSTRWLDTTFDVVDPTLFGRLVGPRGHYTSRSMIPIRYGEAPMAAGEVPKGHATEWVMARPLEHLSEDDLMVWLAASDGGRYFPKTGALSDFRHASHHPESAGDGRGSCPICLSWARQVINTIDHRAGHVAKGADGPPGRLAALARFTMSRTSIGRIALDSFERERRDLGMPAKPSADLPDSITLAISDHPDRIWSVLVYIDFVVGLKYWVTNVDPDAPPEPDLPIASIGRRLVLPEEDLEGRPKEKQNGLDEAEAWEAWSFIERACAANPASQRKLSEHLLDHLPRRLGGTALDIVGEDGRSHLHPDVEGAIVREAAEEPAKPLVDRVCDRLLEQEEEQERKCCDVTRDQVKEALAVELQDLANVGEFDQAPGYENLQQALAGDPEQGAMTEAFEAVCDDILAQMPEYRDAGDMAQMLAEPPTAVPSVMTS